MPTTYTNGLKLPDLGSIDWYSSYKNNIDILDPIVGAVNSKQEQLSTTQLAAVNSGITAAAVQQIGTNASNISALQTAVSGKAADNAVVHLAGAETISGDKTFTGAVVTHNITPETDNTYSLGNSSYQWASVYAQTYYYGTTSFTDKFVTVDTEQSISKVKEFTQSNADTLRLKNSRVAIGETISSDVFTQFSFRDKNTDNLAYIRDTYFADGSTVLSFYVRNKYANGAPSTTGLVFYAYWGIGVDATGKPFASVRGDLAPYSNATYNLGTSSNKWKTLNGINPGALGMIDTSTYVDIDTSTWVSDGVAANRVYINGANPTFPGYLFIRAAGSSTDFLAVRLAGTTTDKPMWTAPYYPAGGGLLYVIVPCPASTSIRVYTTVAPTVCRYFACLGNV